MNADGYLSMSFPLSGHGDDSIPTSPHLTLPNTSHPFPMLVLTLPYLCIVQHMYAEAAKWTRLEWVQYLSDGNG